MSGIIGGVGSKSGVIGTTELDVEEGEWAMSSWGFDVTGSFTSSGRYVRIGKMVHISACVRGSTNIATSGGASTIGGGLPFTISNGANNLASYIANSGGALKHGYAWLNSLYTIYGGNTEFSASTDGIEFALHYEVA